jgi:hypothetical protein
VFDQNVLQGVSGAVSAIFVETNEDESGYLFQVTGNIQEGMSFGHRNTEDSDKWTIGKELLGTVTHENHDRIQSVVEAVEPPKKQFNGPRRIDPSQPIRRCQEWTADAIEALKDAGVLET